MAKEFVDPDLASFAASMLKLREWERSRVPMFAPQIALDVILYAVANLSSGQMARTKDFHLAIGNSQDRVREVMRFLENDGWIRSEADPSDARLKRIAPCKKSIDLVASYQERCSQSYDWRSRLAGQQTELIGTEGAYRETAEEFQPAWPRQ